MVVEREFKCLFYKVVSKENAVSKINAFFAEINPMTPLSTESIGNLSYYLRSDIRKTDTYLLFTIAKVDLNKFIYLNCFLIKKINNLFLFFIFRLRNAPIFY